MIKIIFFGYSSCGDSQTVESWEEVQEDWLHILQQAVLRSRPEPAPAPALGKIVFIKLTFFIHLFLVMSSCLDKSLV